ncbi:2TM domain-containing protein [Nonomuraea sp. M3C6]|uniref:2TM domain-containing protein n=1 Tax=Nonomuraea marmarensis TaxID=3351344 RepID=A0ABW7AF21_9ACTN
MRSVKREGARKWGLRIHLLFYALANLAQLVVWQVYDSEHFFWPLWPIVFWGVGLAFHFWGVYSTPTSKTSR